MSEKINLKAIREKKGITIQEVFEATKISKRVILAIESGNTTNLFISDVYVKGFAKTYARYLGVDPERVVEELFATEKSKKTKKEPESADLQTDEPMTNTKASGISNKILGIVKVLKTGTRFIRDMFLWCIMSVLSAILKVPKKVWWLIAVVALIGGILILLPKNKDVDVDKNTAIKQNDVLEKQHKEKISAEVTSDAESMSKNKEDAAPQTQPANSGLINTQKSGVNILVRATSNSWLRVRADGKEVFRATLHKGDVETWSAKEEISMWLGNAGGIEVECAGKVYKGFGRRGKVIKNLTFYPDCSYEIKR